MDAGQPATSRSISRFTGPGGSGMVNELLIQLQSFDQPPMRQRVMERVIEWLNGYLPEGKSLRAGRPKYHNILLIAATNRADALDPALLRPGRFDRRLYFDLPTKAERGDLINFLLDREKQHSQLDDLQLLDSHEHETFGY